HRLMARNAPEENTMSRGSCGRWVGLLWMIGLAGCQRDAARIVPLTLVADAAQSQTYGTRINPIDGAQMVYIPAGEFLMGSDPEELERIWKKFHWTEAWKPFTKGEQPAHRVRVKEFWMYQNDVTVVQYRKFCAATGRAMPAAPAWGWTDTHPIVNVSW